MQPRPIQPTPGQVEQRLKAARSKPKSRYSTKLSTFLTLLTLAILLFAFRTWCWSQNHDWVEWVDHIRYLGQFRPVAFATWVIDPSGWIPLEMVVVGIALQIRRWRKPGLEGAHLCWGIGSLILAATYLDSAMQLQLGPLSWRMG